MTISTLAEIHLVTTYISEVVVQSNQPAGNRFWNTADIVNLIFEKRVLWKRKVHLSMRNTQMFEIIIYVKIY